MSLDVNKLMLAKTCFVRRGSGKIVEAKIVAIDFNNEEVIVSVPWLINWDIIKKRFPFSEYTSSWALYKAELVK